MLKFQTNFHITLNTPYLPFLRGEAGDDYFPPVLVHVASQTSGLTLQLLGAPFIPEERLTEQRHRRASRVEGVAERIGQVGPGSGGDPRRERAAGLGTSYHVWRQQWMVLI